VTRRRCLKALCKSLDGLDKVLKKFNPVNELKRPFPPMAAYRNRLQVATAKARADLDRQTTGSFRVTDLALTRAAWSKNRKSAGESGLAVVKSGVGAALDEFNEKLQAVQAKPNKQECRAEFAVAAKDLENVLRAFYPRDDFGEPHIPMVEYRDQLLAQVAEVRRTTGAATLGDWAPTDFSLDGRGWRATKAEAVEHGMEDYPTGIGEHLDELAAAQKAYDRQSDDRELKLACLTALTHAGMILEAFDPRDDYGQPFAPMVAYRQRLLAAVANSRGSIEKSEQTSWKAPAPVLSHKGWQEVKAQAVEHGMVDVPTGIGKAFHELRAAEQEFHQTRGDREKRRAFVARLEKLVNLLAGFAPTDDCGNPFAPMVEYRDGVVELLEKLWDDIAKASTVAWTPTEFTLTRAGWQRTKQAAVNAGWLEEQTGLGEALKTFEEAHKELAARPKKRKNRIALLNALDGVKAALTALKPADDFRRPHPGMIRYREGMLAEVQRRTEELEANRGGDWAPTNFAFTQAAWQETKRDALRDGWVEVKSGVGEAYEVLQKALASHAKHPEDARVLKLANRACTEVRLRLERLNTRRADKSTHPGMVEYRDLMLANLTGIENRLAGGGE
jgi:hypothetical protein